MRFNQQGPFPVSHMSQDQGTLKDQTLLSFLGHPIQKFAYQKAPNFMPSCSLNLLFSCWFVMLAMMMRNSHTVFWKKTKKRGGGKRKEWELNLTNSHTEGLVKSTNTILSVLVAILNTSLMKINMTSNYYKNI
jgi:hypothetical protein